MQCGAGGAFDREEKEGMAERVEDGEAARDSPCAIGSGDHFPHETESVSQQTYVCAQASDMCNTSDHVEKAVVSRGVISLQQLHPERGSKDSFFVSVVFPGLVTREGCCIFTRELLKHILYQRQQLPLPYDQLVYFFKKQQKQLQQCDEACRKKPRNAEVAENRRCQRALADLDEILCNLETLFTLTLVPRVLILLGGSTVCPKELYEINMEGVLAGNAGQSLKTPPCLRKLFHSLFVADAFSEFKTSPIMGAVLMVLAHRDCGTDWFKPKLNYRVPTRCKKLIVNLSCSEELASLPLSPQQTTRASSDDYVWFQAPLTLKGFRD